MLNEQRYEMILNELNHKGTVSLKELMPLLNSSESTIRRDLLMLEKEGKLKRIHGGAVLKDAPGDALEQVVETRRGQHTMEKKRIGQAAACYVDPGDFVYIDAGTTTEWMLDSALPENAFYFTNALRHAQILAEKGLKVYIPGGQFKAVTQAIVGEEAAAFLEKYNFTKGFFGTNAISADGRLTTPDPAEASIKERAMKQCAQCYILADASKLNQLTQITFGHLNGHTLISDADKEEMPDSGVQLIHV